MFRNREEMRRRLQEIIERFRQKGATSPEKAMTIQELGLPPRFEEAMHRRLGQSGIFVEINGKYYLNEERLKQIQEQRAKRGSGSGGGAGWSRAGPPTLVPRCRDFAYAADWHHHCPCAVLLCRFQGRVLSRGIPCHFAGHLPRVVCGPIAVLEVEKEILA